MAIIPGVPGLKVEVCVDGTPLREYHDDDEDDEDEDEDDEEASQHFSVKITFNDNEEFRTPHGVRAKMKLDGTVVKSSVWATLSSRTEWTFIKGARIGESDEPYLRRFRFTELDIVEDNESTNVQRPHNIHELGQITVAFHYVTNIRTVETLSDLDVALPLQGQIAEKVLKGRAISHCGKLDPPERQKGVRTSLRSDDVDPYSRPFAKFVFRYRSKAALQALHLIQRTPSPVQLEDRPEEELSQVELQELVRRLKARDAAAAKIKKEGQSKTPMKRGRKENDDEERDDEDEDVAFVVKRPKKERRLPGKGDRVVELD